MHINDDFFICFDFDFLVWFFFLFQIYTRLQFLFPKNQLNKQEPKKCEIKIQNINNSIKKAKKQPTRPNILYKMCMFDSMRNAFIYG